ncbi:MAG TPA: DUF4375 domain-containing protein [Caulobacterales bacterium]|nr:DUF4375 domain-containing protein [Caulobacterales bacterium]
MSDEQTTCVRCGKTILVLTAQELGGQCVPCSRGDRERIEAGRRRYYDQKAFLESDVWKFWLKLVQTPVASMNSAELAYFSANLLRGEVLNGGFHQFFFNSSGVLYEDANRGLAELGAEQTRSLAALAKSAIFGEQPVTEETQQRLLQWSLADEALGRRLHQLDRAFYEDPDKLWNRLQSFGVSNGFYARAWVEPEN